MNGFLRIDSQGSLSPENETVQRKLAQKKGRFFVPPTSPDLLLGVRGPVTGEIASSPRVVLAGEIPGIPLVDALAFLSQIRMTGTLRVLSPVCERAVVFKAGEVHSSASDNPCESIGEIAVRLGMLPRAQLNKVLAKKPPLHRVGRLLVEADHLRPHDLWRCVQLQASEIFHAILLSDKGVFLFVDEPVEERGGLGLDTQGLLMDAIRRIDEMKEFRKRLPSSNAYIVQTKTPNAPLEDNEQKAFDLCTGDKTIAQIAQALSVTEFDATKVIYHLLMKGWVSAQATPSRKKSSKQTQPGEIIRVFNFIYREILGEIEKVNMGSELIASANVAIVQRAFHNPVLQGVYLTADGTLSDDALANLEKLVDISSSKEALLYSALSELMFFLLFEAGELLEPKIDEDLARRVKELLATIESPLQ